MNLRLGSYQISSRIDSEKDKEKDGKAPERRASITEERKRDADNRSESQYHTYINKHVKEEDTEYTVTIYSPKLEGLPLGKNNQPDDQSQEQQQPPADPKNPSSSPTVQKMKSVSCSGTNFSLVCVPLRKPFP